MKRMAMMIGAVARCADGCVIIQSPYCNAPVVPHVIVIKKHTSDHHDQIIMMMTRKMSTGWLNLHIVIGHIPSTLPPLTH